MSIFRQPQTDPQAELRELQNRGAEQDEQIKNLRQHDVFRSAVVTPAEYGAIRDEIELLQTQRALTRTRERELQSVIDDDLRLVADRQALADVTVEEAAAAKQVREASTLCAKLDSEYRSWQLRKDQALHAFYESLKRHNEAKSRLSALSKRAYVRPVVTAKGAIAQA